MSRRAAKVDDNQGYIVGAFKVQGWSVKSLAAVGDGVHDLIIGRAGINVLVEVKDEDKPPSRRKLTDAQVDFHASWAGPQDICCSVEEALRIAKFWHDRAMGIHARDQRDRSDELEVPGS